MYQPPPFGYAQGAPGLAPGMSAPSGYPTQVIPPNFNFNAPVIHFGQSLSGATVISIPDPAKLQATAAATPTFVKEPEGPRLPPSAEDQLHTVFVGNIPDDLSDEWLERIARSLGKLKEWRRAVDGQDKPRSFGFAIFEDAESTNTAFRMLEDFAIPAIHSNKKPTKLSVRIDESTVDYLATLGTSQNVADTDKELTIRSYLAQVMEELKDPAKRQPKTVTKQETEQVDNDIDVDEADYIPVMNGGTRTSGVVPTAQREIIQKEITAFRERSNKRDRNKTLYEELDNKPQSNRDQSPLQSDSRRRDRSQERDDRKGHRSAQDSIPSGPAADRRRPREYVKFRPGSDRYDRDEDEDIPDDELERRRLQKKRRDLELAFIDKERKWLSREKMRTSALEREITRSKNEDRTLDKETMLGRLAKWDDDIEAERQVEEYYKDRQLWARKRVEFRRKEKEKDDRDRDAESRELNKDKSRAAALADSFLEQQAFEINAKVNPEQQGIGIAQPLRLRMTRESFKTAPASPAKRTVEEVEGLLEEDDEEESYKPSAKKRMLIPLEYDGDEPVEDSASKAHKLRAVVASIPSDTKGLWEYPIQWDVLDNAIIENKLRPFATKKIIEAFGIQEQEIIDFVIDHISSHGPAEALAKELEMTLDEEAEIFVKKMWRMLILETEAKKRKIST